MAHFNIWNAQRSAAKQPATPSIPAVPSIPAILVAIFLSSCSIRELCKASKHLKRVNLSSHKRQVLRVQFGCSGVLRASHYNIDQYCSRQESPLPQPAHVQAKAIECVIHPHCSIDEYQIHWVGWWDIFTDHGYFCHQNMVYVCLCFLCVFCTSFYRTFAAQHFSREATRGAPISS